MSRRGSQNGPDVGGVGVGQRQGKGDKFIFACGDLVQDQVFEYAYIVLQYGLVAVQSLAVGRIDAGGVQADKQDTAPGKQFYGFGSEGGEVIAPGGDVGLFAGAHQYAWRGLLQERDRKSTRLNSSH